MSHTCALDLLDHQRVRLVRLGSGAGRALELGLLPWLLAVSEPLRCARRGSRGGEGEHAVVWVGRLACVVPGRRLEQVLV